MITDGTSLETASPSNFFFAAASTGGSLIFWLMIFILPILMTIGIASVVKNREKIIDWFVAPPPLKPRKKLSESQKSVHLDPLSQEKEKSYGSSNKPTKAA